MTAPTFSAAQVSSTATAGTNHALPSLSGFSSGDLAIAAVAKGAAGTTTAPSDWTELLDTTNLSVFVRKMDGTENGSAPTFTTSASVQVAVQVRRVAAAEWCRTLAGVSIGSTPSTANGTSTAPNPGSNTPPWDNADNGYLEIVGCAGNVTCSAYSTGYSGGEDDSSSASGSPATIVSASKGTTNSTSDDAAALTISASVAWRAVTVAVAPAGQPILLGVVSGTSVSVPDGENRSIVVVACVGNNGSDSTYSVGLTCNGNSKTAREENLSTSGTYVHSTHVFQLLEGEFNTGSNTLAMSLTGMGVGFGNTLTSFIYANVKQELITGADIGYTAGTGVFNDSVGVTVPAKGVVISSIACNDNTSVTTAAGQQRITTTLSLLDYEATTLASDAGGSTGASWSMLTGTIYGITAVGLEPFVAPSLVSSTPTDNATDVEIDANIVLEFDSVVTAGTGSFTIERVSDDAVLATIAVGSGAVSIVGDTVTINPSVHFAHNTEYRLLAPAGILQNWDGITSDTALTWTTKVPVVSALSPPDNATGVDTAPLFEITFGAEPLINLGPGPGRFELRRTSDNSLVEAITSVTIPVNSARFSATDPLLPSTEYYVLVDANAIDGFAGISSTTAWSFTTRALAVANLSPVDNATGLDVDLGFTITFDGAAVEGTGDIEIFDEFDNLVETIPIANATFVGNTVSFSPTAPLDYSTNYYINVDSGAVIGWTGISDSTTWSFATGAAPPPVVASSVPFRGQTSVPVDITIVITLDRNIQAGTGNVYLRNRATGAAVATYDIGDPEIAIGGPNLSLTPASDLDPDTTYYVTWDAGAFESTLGVAVAANASAELVTFSCKTPTLGAAIGGALRGIWVN